MARPIQEDHKHQYSSLHRYVFCHVHLLLKGFLGAKFDMEIKGRADGIVNATIEVYERISKELLPTPARCYSLTSRVEKDTRA